MKKKVTVILLIMLFVMIPHKGITYVYSVDGMIDVDRMATDKMYYDFYYNPQTRLFQRGDTQPLSPIAQALLKKAIESRIDRASGADQAGRSEYNKIMTGTNACLGDPFVGTGTNVNPEIQSPEQPKCTTGGAAFADESIGYVYLIDGAYETQNAKEVTNSFRTQKYNNPVPRAFEAPSSNYTYVGEKYIIHDSGGMVWRNGVPVGLEVMNWTGNCPGGYNPKTGQRCFDIVNDDAKVSFTDEAHWADHATTAQMLGKVDFNRVKIDMVKTTLNEDRRGNILQRNYTFLINNYTITKGNVQFCEKGWRDLTTNISGIPDKGNVFKVNYCGGESTCYKDSCSSYDSSGNCTGYNYKCDVKDACIFARDCAQITVDSVSVSNQPVTISITLPGSDTRLEPPNPDTKLIYQTAKQQLPELVTVPSDKKLSYHTSISSISKCSGTPASWWGCH